MKTATKIKKPATKRPMTPQPKPENGRKKTKPTLVSFILDETGSMDSVKQTAISSFNEFIETMNASKTNANMTLTKFNSEKVEIVFSDLPISKVSPLNSTTYRPAHLTPLYDAIGKTLNELEKKTEKGQKVMVIILTDGFENASKEYTREKVYSLITEKKAKGWEFTFLGANQDAWDTGQQIGIPTMMSATILPTARGIRSAVAAASNSTLAYMSGKSISRQDAYNQAYSTLDDTKQPVSVLDKTKKAKK